MQACDRKVFAELLESVMTFYKRPINEFALGIWWEACSAFDFEQVRKAMTAHAMDPEQGRFAPMPADIVKQLHGTRTDRALIAWSLVYEAIGQHGAYATVEFADAAAQRAIHDMGGWIKLCSTETAELQFVQKRFCEMYRAYAARPDLERPPALVGIHGLDPRSQPKVPILIGTRPAASLQLGRAA